MPTFDKARPEPIALLRFAVELADEAIAGEHVQSARFEATVRFSDGNNRCLRGDITPFLTTAQLNNFKTLLVALTVKAETEMLAKL